MFTQPRGHKVNLGLYRVNFRVYIQVTLLTPLCNPSCQMTRCDVLNLALLKVVGAMRKEVISWRLIAA